MWSFAKPALLSVEVNGQALCTIRRNELPCEKKPSVRLGSSSTLELIDADGAVQRHELGPASGWFHFSIRVHPNLACQADCVVTDSETYDPNALVHGDAIGIRFQPFFLTGAKVKNEDLYGQGLFARGLHFAGYVTNGGVVLSCLCDRCKRSFQIRSFHAGFSNAAYFYSESGKHTLIVSDRVAGCPQVLSEPDAAGLAALEAALPSAPDGTRYRYMSSFRCCHCAAPYIDFDKHPEQRRTEYYGNYFVGAKLLRYAP